jgi:IS5 family transposase
LLSLTPRNVQWSVPKKQRQSYSGKKKRHTQKAQLVVDTKTKQILATAFSNGKEHDFKLFGKSRTALLPQTKCLADRGYLGIAKLHANSQTPHKRSKRHPLSKEQKQENRQLSRERFLVEHVIRSVKIFRILAERYRNRRKRFGLRFNLIAALCNAELAN